jgi:NAD(P)-dependent dehydrogenase (short-subunit alcohol dehydrogenase family)
MFRKMLVSLLLSLGFVGYSGMLKADTTMTALVTGANRGIGLELVRQLSARGYKVIGTARDPEEATELNATGALVVPLDVTDSSSVRAMAQALEGQKIDLLINNAGIMGHNAKSFEETDFDKVITTFDVNSLGPMRVTQALLPNLLAGDGKTVVQISSTMGSIANNSGGYYGYRSSKSALNMLNKSLALELAELGITSVVLHPGWVQTRLGGANAAITTQESVVGMIKVITGLGPEDNGRFLDYKGDELPW